MKIKKNIPQITLIIIHFFGIVGLLSPYNVFFLAFTPYNLILSGFILFYYQKELNTPFLVFFFITFILGFLFELIGVKTGLIFGEYTYGKTLGLKFFDIPILMGLNWVTLIYSIGSIFNSIKISTFFKCFLGAISLMILDFFIEPVAIAFDFWSWKTISVPNQNYVAWFIISFLFLMFFYQLNFKKENKVSVIYFVIQIIFFFTLSWY